MSKIIATNKRARYDFFILKKYIAGIELKGWEVKSIRNGSVDIKNTFCTFKNHELFAINMLIKRYMHVPGDETRSRKLLLNKNELNQILKKTEEQKLTIVALALKWTKNLIKLEIGLAKGKTKIDKRETIKKRDAERKVREFY